MNFNPERHRKAFWAALKHFLAQKILTQAELAEKLGVSRQYISRLASERAFGTEITRRKLAAICGFDGSTDGKGYEDFLSFGEQVLTVTETLEDDAPFIAKRTVEKPSGPGYRYQDRFESSENVSAAVAAVLLSDIERHSPESFSFVFSIIKFLHHLIIDKAA